MRPTITPSWTDHRSARPSQPAKSLPLNKAVTSDLAASSANTVVALANRRAIVSANVDFMGNSNLRRWASIGRVIVIDRGSTCPKWTYDNARLGESSYIMLDSESQATSCSTRSVELHANAVRRIPVAASGVVELELVASEGFVNT